LGRMITSWWSRRDHRGFSG